eukprot:5647834-Pleurochrysis_carterae.AAC.2
MPIPIVVSIPPHTRSDSCIAPFRSNLAGGVEASGADEAPWPPIFVSSNRSRPSGISCGAVDDMHDELSANGSLELDAPVPFGLANRLNLGRCEVILSHSARRCLVPALASTGKGDK